MNFMLFISAVFFMQPLCNVSDPHNFLHTSDTIVEGYLEIDSTIYLLTDSRLSYGFTLARNRSASQEEYHILDHGANTLISFVDGSVKKKSIDFDSYNSVKDRGHIYSYDRSGQNQFLGSQGIQAFTRFTDDKVYWRKSYMTPDFNGTMMFDCYINIELINGQLYVPNSASYNVEPDMTNAPGYTVIDEEGNHEDIFFFPQHYQDNYYGNNVWQYTPAMAYHDARGHYLVSFPKSDYLYEYNESYNLIGKHLTDSDYFDKVVPLDTDSGRRLRKNKLSTVEEQEYAHTQPDFNEVFYDQKNKLTYRIVHLKHTLIDYKEEKDQNFRISIIVLDENLNKVAETLVDKHYSVYDIMFANNHIYLYDRKDKFDGIKLNRLKFYPGK